jgi:hypothetical protein
VWRRRSSTRSDPKYPLAPTTRMRDAAWRFTRRLFHRPRLCRRDALGTSSAAGTARSDEWSLTRAAVNVDPGLLSDTRLGDGRTIGNGYRPPSRTRNPAALSARVLRARPSPARIHRGTGRYVERRASVSGCGHRRSAGRACPADRTRLELQPETSGRRAARTGRRLPACGPRREGSGPRRGTARTDRHRRESRSLALSPVAPTRDRT